MSHWVNETIYGTFACFFCGSLMVQIGQKWVCTDVHCRQHDDMPVEQSRGFGGWGNSSQFVSTASGTTPYMVISDSTTTT